MSLPLTHSPLATVPARPAARRPPSLWRDAWALTGRTFDHWRTRPGALAVQLLFPVLIVLMMGGLFGGAIAGTAGAYMPFVVPGVLTLTMLFGIEATMTAVATDAAKALTDRFRSLPISAGAVLLGRVIADMAASVLELSVMTLAGLALGWRPGGGLGAALLAYVLLLWLRLALLWLGLLFGLRAAGPESIAAVQILVWPVGFLSTVFLDPATMPRWLGVAAEWNPLSATATAVRDLFGNPGVAGLTWASEHAALLAVAWPAALLAVAVPLATRAYRRLGA